MISCYDVICDIEPKFLGKVPRNFDTISHMISYLMPKKFGTISHMISHYMISNMAGGDTEVLT